LNTLHFKYAVEVERTGSITQAAENLFMGQPNLSKAIMELEETLGFQIFERTSKGVLPTDKGAVFLVYAKNILASIEKMEALSDKNSAGQALGVAFPRSLYIASAVNKLASELDFSGKVRLNIRETNSVQIINSVAAGTFNLGIVRYRLLHEKYFMDYIRDKDLDVIPFWEFDSMVLTSERHYRGVEKISYPELGGMTPITFGDESIPYLSFGEVRREAKSPAADKAVFVYDRSTAIELLQTLPDAYMLTAPIGKRELEKHRLTQKKCEIPNERTKDVIIFQKGYKLTEWDRRFVDILSEIKNETEFDLR
jgi:DNA-binding transcriptional LysR family regulator